MEKKAVWKSKTFWFNLLALVVMITNEFGFGEFQADPNLESYALVIVTVVNIVLRLITKQPVKLP